MHLLTGGGGGTMAAVAQAFVSVRPRTGLSIGNVGYRLHHILKQLAGKLRQFGIEGTP